MDVENESGVYVIIDKFEIEGNVNGSYSSNSHPTSLRSLKEKLDKVGISLPTKLYAFKKAVRGKVEGKKNWTNLFVWLKKELKKTMEEKKLVQKYVDRIHALENNPEELPDIGSKGFKTVMLEDNNLDDKAVSEMREVIYNEKIKEI